MAFTFNGTSPSIIIFNGNDVEHVDVVSGGTTTRVWDKVVPLTQLIMYQNGTINTSAITGFSAGSMCGYSDQYNPVPTNCWGIVSTANPTIQTTKTNVYMSGLNHLDCSLYGRLPCSFDEAMHGWASATIYVGVYNSNGTSVGQWTGASFNNWHSSRETDGFTCSLDFTPVEYGYVKIWLTSYGGAAPSLWFNNLILSKK